MTFSLLYIIIGITVIFSFSAFKDQVLFDKLLFSAYKVSERKEWYRLISNVLVHADVTHLLFNMMSLYFLGELLEYSMIGEYGLQLGEIHFLLIYVFGGIFANFYSLLKHKNNPNYQSVGASGAVSAIIFACILWNPEIELFIFLIPIPIPAYIFGPIYLAIEYFAFKKGGTNIAHDAHIAGAIFGVLYILIINFDKGINFINLFIS